MRNRAAIVAALIIVGCFLAAIPVILKAPAAEAQSVRTNTVNIVDSSFSPNDVTILKGSTVTWTRGNDEVHTVTSNDASETYDSIVVPKDLPQPNNQPLTHTFDDSGTFTYKCKIHPNTMTGTVRVVDSFGVALPTLNVTATNASAFTPDFINASAGQTISWLNTGTVNHTVTFENSTIGDLGDFGFGEYSNYTFAQNGSYRYRCLYHSDDNFEVGMVGKVVVGGNPSFPSTVIIAFPQNGSEVAGVVTINGTIKPGVGRDPVTSVEISFGVSGNWTAANGTSPWSFTWDTTQFEHGNLTVFARALVNTTEESRDSVEVEVHNHEDDEGPKKKGGLPGFEAVLVIVAALATLALRRRRA